MNARYTNLRRLAFPLCAAIATVCSAAEPGKTAWTPVGLAGGGAMFAMSASPHDRNLMMLACDMSADYLSRDGGTTWDMINRRDLRSHIHCPALFDPVRPDVIYAPHGGDNSLRISTDAGRTWKAASPKSPWQDTMVRLYSDRGRFFVGTERELWTSADGLQTWKRCAGIRGRLLGMCADRTRPATYVAGTDAGIFVSTDGGNTFSRLPLPFPDRAVTAFAGGSDGRKTLLYAAVECRNEGGRLTGGIQASADGGKTWKSLMNPELNTQVRRGSEWANSDMAQYRFLMTTDKLPERVYVYCPGTSYFPPNHSTVYRSDNAGATWKAVFFSDPRFKGLYNVEDDRLTLGIGQRYQSVPFSLEINPGDPDSLMMSTDMYVYTTRDGGRNWQVGQGGKPVKFGQRHAWPCNGLVVTTAWNYYIDPFDARRRFICYTDIGLAHSVDAGQTWVWDGPAIPWKNTTYELAFDPAVKGRVWGAFSETHDIPNGNIVSGRHSIIPRGGVAVSTDHGETWTKCGMPEGPCVSVVVDPASPPASRILYASVFEKGVYKSVDGGRRWTLKNAGLGSRANLRACRLILHKDGALFCLVTAKKLGNGDYEREGPGIYRSTDGAETWEKINGSRPLIWPKDFAVNPADSKTVLVGAGTVRGHDESGLYRTTDGGRTWSLAAKKGMEHFGAAYHPHRKGWIYMTMCEGAEDAPLYLSRDDGKTWAPFADLPFSNIMRVHFDPADPDRILLSTFGSSVLRGPAAPP